MRILVIGGGIGGLTAAIALRQVGIDVQVYEQAPALREVGSGLGLMTNALWTLDALGLGEEICSHSHAAMQGGLRRWDGRVLANADTGTVAVMHRAELLAVLGRRIDLEHLHLSRACVGFEQTAAGVTAHFENGELAHGDGLIGADGGRSVVRTELLGSRPVKYAGYTCWRAVVELKTNGKLTAGETWGRGRRFGIIPMSHGRVYWFATNNALEGKRVPPGQIKQLLTSLFQGWHEPIRDLIEAAEEGAILQNDIYDMNPLPNFTQGKVALLGDAAHLMTPNLGQGACQAIEDGVVLAASLKNSTSVPAGLLEYEKRRVPRTSQIVLRSRWLGAIAQGENPALCWMRDTAVLMTPKRIAARQIKSMLEAEILKPSEKALFAQSVNPPYSR